MIRASKAKIYSLFLTILFCFITIISSAQNSDSSAFHWYPKKTFFFGLSDRYSRPLNEPFNIRYVNESDARNDTFKYHGDLRSHSNMVNFIMGIGLCNKYIGFNMELGFIPFYKKNNHQSLNVFALIPINEKVVISPSVGYTRTRKTFKLGYLKNDIDKLNFQNNEFSELKIKAIQDFHSYTFGLSTICDLDGFLFSFELKHYVDFHTASRLRVLGYKDEDPSILGSILGAIFPANDENFKHNGKTVIIEDQNNLAVNGFIQPYKWSFSVKMLIDIDNSGSTRKVTKFMGAQ